MPYSHEFPPRGSSSSGGMASSSLEHRFELLKEIGDGSFGSVALARVRTAGANIALRGTLVRPSPSPAHRDMTDDSLGCNQDHEENFRLVRPLSRPARGHLPPITSRSSPPGPRSRHFSGPVVEEATHLHGIYGRQPLSAYEIARPQMPRLQQREECSLPDSFRSGPHTCAPFLPP